MLGGTAYLAAEVAAGNTSGGIHALGILDSEREEALALLQGCGAHGNQHDSAAALGPHCAVCLVGNAASLKDILFAEDIACHSCGRENIVVQENLLEKGTP